MQDGEAANEAEAAAPEAAARRPTKRAVPDDALRALVRDLALALAAMAARVSGVRDEMARVNPNMEPVRAVTKFRWQGDLTQALVGCDAALQRVPRLYLDDAE